MRLPPLLSQIGSASRSDAIVRDAERGFILFFSAVVVGGLGLLALGIRRRREFARLGMLRPADAADLSKQATAIESLARGVGRREADLETERRERRRAEEDAGHHRELLAKAESARIQLGRDLHDGMIQALYAAGLTLESARPLLATDPAEADRRIARAIGGLNAAIRDARSWIDGLSPEAVRAAGVAGAIRSATDPLIADGALSLQLKIDEDAAALLDSGIAAQLIPIVREAASNALRHGGASSVSVRLERGNRSVCLLVQDDGRGFQPGPGPGASGGHGLVNMEARARALGGTLSVTSEPGHGTRVLLTLPDNTPGGSP